VLESDIEIEETCSEFGGMVICGPIETDADGRLVNSCVFSVVLGRDTEGTDDDFDCSESASDTDVSDSVVCVLILDREMLVVGRETLVVGSVSPVFDNEDGKFVESPRVELVGNEMDDREVLGKDNEDSNKNDGKFVESPVMELKVGDCTIVESPRMEVVGTEIDESDTEPTLLLGTERLEIATLEMLNVVKPSAIGADVIGPKTIEGTPKLDNVIESPLVTTGRAPEIE
jgi:hypothetical protein